MSEPIGQWFTLGKATASGYGPRVFLIDGTKPDCSVALDDAHRHLAKVCCWGGSDKKWDSAMGEWWGYELRHETYDAVIAFLTELLGEPVESTIALR